MSAPEDLEERSRRDALVEPLFGGLDATQANERDPSPQRRSRLASARFWLLLLLVCLASWLLF